MTVIPYRTESVHFFVLLNSATKFWNLTSHKAIPRSLNRAKPAVDSSIALDRNA